MAVVGAGIWRLGWDSLRAPLKGSFEGILYKSFLEKIQKGLRVDRVAESGCIGFGVSD